MDKLMFDYENTSKNYKLLWELIDKTRIICLFERKFKEDSDIVFETVGANIARKDSEYKEIGYVGCAVVSADSFELFEMQCKDINLSFIIPQKYNNYVM